ncbi:MAG: tyrosine-type recombinase/integrase [Calothrix sp. MO_167.B12]|nr:tyrosine-type recombinase/integrase [Calothrix sp. MO_167.B12]
MKNNRNGKAAIINEREYAKIRKEIVSAKYRLLLDLAWFTGERWGALLQLEVSDVFNDDGSPRKFITFKARTRKASPDGKRETRQVPTHETLQELLTAYKLPKDNKFLFPNRAGDSTLKLRVADKIFRTAVEKAGLGTKGISTHSTRRSFITRLWKKGVDMFSIKQITGHKSYQVLERYIEDDTNRIQEAINLL